MALALLACSGTISAHDEGSQAEASSTVPQAEADPGLDEPGANGGMDGAEPASSYMTSDTTAPGSLEPDAEQTGSPYVEPSEGNGDLEAPPAPPREYCDAMEKVFHVNCGNGSCHSNAGANIGDFAIDLVHARNYVDRVSVRDPSCGLVIDSAQPLRSLMLTKVTGDFPSGCGGIMPVGSFDVSEEQIDCLADWVLQFKR